MKNRELNYNRQRRQLQTKAKAKNSNEEKQPLIEEYNVREGNTIYRDAKIALLAVGVVAGTGLIVDKYQEYRTKKMLEEMRSADSYDKNMINKIERRLY